MTNTATTQSEAPRETEARPEEGAAPESAGAPRQPEPDNIDALLAEYNEQDIEPAVAGESADGVSVDDFEALRAQLDGHKAAAAQRRDAEDAAIVLALAKEAVDGLDGIDDELIARWLASEMNSNETLMDAWEARYDSEAAADLARRQVGRAIRKMEQYFKTRPDPVATADRMAVAAAVRGASGAPPPKKPFDYSRLTDSEFADAIEREYGYRPL